MPITGDFDSSKLLSSRMDEVSLMRLCRDILYVRGHSQILITNGPGDGQRDLHSISRDGQSFISQCKFHHDFRKACSSRELAELPLALVKMNAKDGLFVTNARVSPQAKREYLDGYPSLSLEFIDGEELVRTVLDNPILKAVWFDGKEVVMNGLTTAFPVIVRRHIDDHPICALQKDDDRGLLIAYLRKKWPTLDFGLRYGHRSVEAFSPYRQPIDPTVEEGLSSWIRVMEVVVDGPYSMADLEKLSVDISRAVVSCLSQDELSATVVIGKPNLASMSTDMLGVLLPTDVAKSNCLFNRSLCILESDFFRADQENGYWLTVNDARVSEANWIRLYSPHLDCALGYELNFAQTTQIEDWKIFVLARARRGWQASVHALLPQWGKEWPYSEIDSPDEKIDWPWSAEVVCAWFHWTLLGEYADNCPSWNDKRSEMAMQLDQQSEDRLANVRLVLVNKDEVKLLTPDKARHMIASVGVDVLAEPLNLRYDTAEIIHFFEDCRSPLLPQNRTFYATVVWPKFFDCNIFEEACTKCLDAGTTLNCYEDGDYLVAELYFNLEGAFEMPTYLILRKLHLQIAKFIGRLEVFEKDSRLAELVTDQYWKEKFNVSLGVDHGQTRKKYFGFSPEEVGFPNSPKIILD